VPRLSRRHFLTLAAAAAAGCTTGVEEEIAPEARLGVIGCGRRSSQLIQVLARDPAYANAQVAAVCDVYRPRLNRVAQWAGALAEPDWRRLVARRDLDAVLIATPDHWHAPMAIAAMEAGKDVYCESPMALTLEQAAAVRSCAARTGRVVQIGAAEASEAQWRLATRIVHSGELGAARWAQAAVNTGPAAALEKPLESGATPENLDWPGFLGNAPIRPFAPDRFFRWRAYWDYSNGIPTSLFASCITPLLIALGPGYPERVSAAGGVYAEDGRETPDSFVLNAEYAAGHSIVLSHSAAGVQPRPAVIRGDRASLEVGEGSVRVTPANSPERLIPVQPSESHLADWLRCIKTRRKCNCDEDLGFYATVATAMGVEAYRRAQTVRYDPASNTVVQAPTRMET